MNELELDNLFVLARQQETALTLAMRVGDDTAAIVAASRLHRILESAQAEVDAALISSSSRGAGLRDMWDASTRSMRSTLQRAPSTAKGVDAQRLLRWSAATATTLVRRGGPHVFELDTGGADLPETQCLGLHIASCRFIADLRRASFVDTFIEASDFTYGNLEETIWHRTTVHRSSLRDSSFRNATLDTVAFFDCDLRNVCFTADAGIAKLTDVQFVRCDLRGATLAGPGARVDVIDCKLNGDRFGAGSGQLNIVRADLSARGDGSWIAGTCSSPDIAERTAEHTPLEVSSSAPWA